jgi:cell division GTPase FtsZ
VKVLLLGLGGGGGNILRSLKAIVQRDLAVTQEIDPVYADRLRERIATRFLDTNAFSLWDVPPEERLLIGAATTKRLGSGHNPDVARAALEESRREVEALIGRYAATILIATGGKGTGAGTIFPIAEMARTQKKLVLPVFVCPSFERHEVEKRRYDHARKVVEQFDRASIRLIEILNDRGYTDRNPQPQSVVWERMNVPIARSLRGLLYVLEDLSQVDPSDLSALFAGPGRLRLAFAEIDAPAGGDPTEEQVDDAVRACCENPYDAFGKKPGTSLICIQGHWSNVIDARIKGRFRSVVAGGAADDAYNPLYARALQTPKPWGVTALFAEHTGHHPSIEIAWPLEDHEPPPAAIRSFEPVDAKAIGGTAAAAVEPVAPQPREDAPAEQPAARVFSSFWDFARAVNRGDAAAIALAGNGCEPAIEIGAAELRKLLTTVWFRSVFERLSRSWRDRLLEAVIEQVPVTNHQLRIGRHTVPLSDASAAQLDEFAMRTDLPESVRSDVQVVTAIGRIWGEEAQRRCQFTGDPGADSSRFDVLRVRSLLLR